MLRQTARKLTVLNLGVFLSVLSIGSVVVYYFAATGIDIIKIGQVRVLGEAVAGSIDAPDEPHEIPDIFWTVDETEPERDELQIFTPDKKLMAQRGALKVTRPLNPDADIETQENPHAIILTQKLYRKGVFLGFLRTVVSLADTDGYKRSLLIGLVSGTIVAAVASLLATFWLVQQALKPVEQSLKILTDFTADASHELKSPITAIKTNCAVALKYPDGMRDSDKEKMSSIVSAADQMNRTISDLLSLTESDYDIATSEAEQINIAAIVSEVTEHLKELASQKDIEIQTSVADPNLTIKIRRVDLHLALLNIIKNAVMYSNPNEKVLVTAKRSDRSVKIEVEDKGIGISKQDIPFVFDRFWRADKARTYQSGGNGLGLSIVKSVVERNRGTVGVKSTANEGSKFCVILPQS